MNMRRLALLAAGTGLAICAAAPAFAGDADWNAKVAHLITANYSYPRSAQLRGDHGTTRIRIAISGTGKVLAVDLVQSSGSPILDREAVRIPSKVGTFPAPPTHANVQLVYPITFRLED